MPSLMTRSLLLLSLLVAAAIGNAEPTASSLLSVIPNPASMKIGRGEFIVDGRAGIRIADDDPELKNAAEYLSELIERRFD